MKKLLAFLLAAVMVVSLAACGGSDANKETQARNDKETTGSSETNNGAEGEGNKDAHINMALFTYIEGMDPAVDWCGWNLTRCGVGETLVTVNEKMEIVGQLADTWEQLDDLTYSFHIRQGVKFSNGTELTPEIVKASIERSVKTNSRGESLKLASIEVEGETVIFKTTEPFSAFLTNLTEPMCCIVDTTADTSDYASKPICTGPYYVTEYVSEERIELAANEAYWDGAPEIKTITVYNIASDTKVDAILAGDIDIAQGPAATTLSRVEGNTSGIEMVRVTGTREDDAILNCAKAPLDNVSVRQALSCAIDRDVLAQVAGNGYATGLSVAFPESVGYGFDQVNGHAYDKEKAESLLKEAGYGDSDGDGILDKDGNPLSLKISLSSTASTAVSEALKDMWGAIGINVEIEMLENVSDIRSNGEFDVIMGGWQTVNAGDGQKYLAARFGTDGTDNYGKYSSEAFDAALGKLDAAFDKDERVAAFVEAQQVLADDEPVLFLYAADNVTLVNTNKVKNVTVFPIDYYLITNKLQLP